MPVRKRGDKAATEKSGLNLRYSGDLLEWFWIFLRVAEERNDHLTMKKKTTGIDKYGNGQLRLRFTVDGVRYTVYGKTIKECREKELEKRKQLEDDTYHESKTLTVNEYFENWLEAKRGTVKDTTLCTERGWYKPASKITVDKAGHQFGKLKMVNVEPQHIRILQRKLADKLNTNTVNACIGLVRSLFKSAITEDRIIVYNPAAGIKDLKRKEKKAVDTYHRALTKDETRSFLEVSQDSWYYNAYVFMLNTGMRLGEVGALRKSDISETGINVKRTLTRDENGNRIIGDDTKTGAGKRFIPLNQDARDAIRRQEEINTFLEKSEAFEPSDLVFRSSTGHLLLHPSVEYDIKKYCKQAGIEPFTAHAFRDTFATRCVESGMQPKTLQAILGHSSISITMDLYVHCLDDTKVQEMKAVSFK